MPRFSVAPCRLPSRPDVELPAKSVVICALYSANMNAAVWGQGERARGVSLITCRVFLLSLTPSSCHYQDVAEFRPERHLDAEAAARHPLRCSRFPLFNSQMLNNTRFAQICLSSVWQRSARLHRTSLCAARGAAVACNDLASLHCSFARYERVCFVVFVCYCLQIQQPTPLSLAKSST